MSNVGKPAGPGSALDPTELPKRKRGRPRKQPQEPAGPLPPKKPRGRPKGSKKLGTVSGQMLVVQGEAYQKTGVQGTSNLSSSMRPATEGTSGKESHRTNRITEFYRRSLNPAPIVAQQQSSC